MVVTWEACVPLMDAGETPSPDIDVLVRVLQRNRINAMCSRSTKAAGWDPRGADYSAQVHRQEESDGRRRSLSLGLLPHWRGPTRNEEGRLPYSVDQLTRHSHPDKRPQTHTE